ncbi:MAG: roadblock/LC7 domain-containing protein [Candidatus Lokiarchaeota archaeon]|nr:roadblock/LC7 domain-containing protein [Candidatus Harpocratesius repetitus]
MSEIDLDKDLQIDLHRMLEALESSTDLEGTALVTKTGLRIASSTHARTDVDQHSASPATLVSLASKVSEGLRYGKLSQIVITGEDGYTIITTSDDSKFMLLSHSKRISKLGYYFHRLSKYYTKLTELLSNIAIGEANY